MGDVQRPTCGAFGQCEPRRRLSRLRPAIARDERNGCQRVRSGLHKGFRRPAGRAASLLSMHRRGDGQALSVQEITKYGDAVPDALPLRIKAKIETITDACLLKAGNQYPELRAWASDK